METKREFLKKMGLLAIGAVAGSQGMTTRATNSVWSMPSIENHEDVAIVCEVFNKAYQNGLDEFYVELENIREGVSQFEGVKLCYDYLSQAPFVK